jgi:hypothetical protein
LLQSVDVYALGPADAKHVNKIHLVFVVLAGDREDSASAHLDVGQLREIKILWAIDLDDGNDLRLVGEDEDTVKGAHGDDLHVGLQRVHFDVVVQCFSPFHQSLAFQIDPDVLLDGVELDVAVHVVQDELVL